MLPQTMYNLLCQGAKRFVWKVQTTTLKVYDLLWKPVRFKIMKRRWETRNFLWLLEFSLERDKVISLWQRAAKTSWNSIIKICFNCRIVWMYASTPSQFNFMYMWNSFHFCDCHNTCVYTECTEKRVCCASNEATTDLNHVIYLGIFTGKLFWSWFGLGIAQMF